LKIHPRGRAALLTASAALAVGLLAPAGAGAATITVTGDDGQQLTLGGPINIRNMSPQVTLTPSTGEDYGFTVTGPNGGQVAAAATCVTPGDTPTTVDYAGNGAYTVNLTRYADPACVSPVATSTLSFSITAAVALGQPQRPVLTRKAGETVPNTLSLPIDLNPGALAHEVFLAHDVVPRPDGSLPGAPQALVPDPTSRSVAVRLDKGPGTYVVVARAKGFAGPILPSAFTAWSAPAVIRAYAPFDLQTFTWTDQRGPSYRFAAVIRAAGASGRVNVAIGRGTKGRYRSYGTATIRNHRFSARFRLGGTGTYRIRLKYKGNATVAPGFDVHPFKITRRSSFRSASIGA
jgi:hypothetical protein